MKKHSVALAVLAVVLCWPGVSLARESRVSTSHLADEPVKEFPLPVLFGVSLASVVPDFGAPRGGGSREHEGQDFMAPLGAPIVSPTAAVVLAVGEGDSAGKYVYTANPGGEQFRYMHLDSIAKIKRGTRLKVGDLIGTVGDTGNAPEGAYHLHFEVRDQDGASDPYPRLDGEFTLKQKASFLNAMLDDVRMDEDEYAEYLVKNFRSDLTAMLRADYTLPRELTAAMKKAGLYREVSSERSIKQLLAGVPRLLSTGLAEGSSGPEVQLLQIFLMLSGNGPATVALAASGPTGYFGPATAAALREVQAQTRVKETGVYDTATKGRWQTYDF